MHTLTWYHSATIISSTKRQQKTALSLPITFSSLKVSWCRIQWDRQPGERPASSELLQLAGSTLVTAISGSIRATVSCENKEGWYKTLLDTGSLTSAALNHLSGRVTVQGSDLHSAQSLKVDKSIWTPRRGDCLASYRTIPRDATERNAAATPFSFHFSKACPWQGFLSPPRVS